MPWRLALPASIGQMLCQIGQRLSPSGTILRAVQAVPEFADDSFLPVRRVVQSNSTAQMPDNLSIFRGQVLGIAFP